VIVARFWHHTRQEATQRALREFVEQAWRLVAKKKISSFLRTDVRERRVASPPSL
jgi:hypothetical protein